MRRLYLALVFPIALIVLIFEYGHFTYAQQPAALVIEGGTLIDGNGGAPVPDSVVVIQGSKITSVSRKGQAAIPAGARIINATGKFVLPGLWDSQTAYSWYFGEALMIHGITSTIDVGTDQETAVPHRDSVLHGKVLAPRSYTGIVRIGSRRSAASRPVSVMWKRKSSMTYGYPQRSRYSRSSAPRQFGKNGREILIT